MYQLCSSVGWCVSRLSVSRETHKLFLCERKTAEAFRRTLGRCRDNGGSWGRGSRGSCGGGSGGGGGCGMVVVGVVVVGS